MKQDTVSEATANNTKSGIRKFLLCVSACFFLIAFSLVAWNLYQLLTFDRAEGVVASVDVQSTTGKTPATFYEVWVGFRANKRQIYTRAGKSVFYSPYDKGDKAIIYYDPKKPETAFVNTFGTIWFLPGILFLIGVVPLIIAGRK